MCALLCASLLACAGDATDSLSKGTDAATDAKTDAETDKVTDKVKEEEDEGAYFVTTLIEKLRDPFVLEHEGRYYVYGTGWNCYKSIGKKLDGSYMQLTNVVKKPADAQKDFWAPEVYEYAGAFYMFTTYYSSNTNHRGCAVFKASRPEGPFEIVSEGHVTPRDWDAIDGTLYIDADGQPWMVFVHEWTSMPDSVGAMAAAKLSPDLTRFISEPIQLFRAKDAPWATSGVTDGCFMYTASNGELLMLWSNFGEDGYRVGVARSSNGKIDGVWTQDEAPIYSKTIQGTYDGGHPMLFTSAAGHTYMAIHSPNKETDGRQARPVFIPFYEQDGVITLDFTKKQG